MTTNSLALAHFFRLAFFILSSSVRSFRSLLFYRVINLSFADSSRVLRVSFVAFLFHVSTFRPPNVVACCAWRRWRENKTIDDNVLDTLGFFALVAIVGDRVQSCKAGLNSRISAVDPAAGGSPEVHNDE